MLRSPLLDDGEYSLWLEHVREKRSGEPGLFWLMWYRNGIPEIPGSSVFHERDIGELAKDLIDALWQVQHPARG